MKQHEIIIMMGAQGSGKGTIARCLFESRDFNYVETGDILRNMDCSDDLGRHITNTINAGNMIDDEILFEILAPILNAEKDILFDGFPRSVPQAEWLIDWVASQNCKSKIKVIYLDIPAALSLERIAKRNAAGYRREDDADINSIKKRLAIYNERTFPLVNWWRENPTAEFIKIDASQDVPTVLCDILKRL